MSDSSQLPPTKPGRRRPITSKLSEALLDFLPFAAILVDTQSGRIILGNRYAADVSTYTRAELVDLELEALFPGWQAENLAQSCATSTKKQPHPLILQELNRRNRTQLSVQLLCAPLPSTEEQVLVIIEPNQLASQESIAPLPPLEKVWSSLESLVGITNTADLQTALEQALQVGEQLSAAGSLVVYLAQEDSPHLLRCAAWGDAEHLPEELTAQELVNLRRPRYWSRGSRPTSELQRAARAASLACLASAPLGQPNALVGLVALGDARALPAQATLAIASLLATVITPIIEQHTLAVETQTAQDALQARLLTSLKLEEHMGEGLLQLDSQLRISQVNSAAEIMLGYAASEVIGQPAENILIGSISLTPALKAALAGSPTYGLGDLRLYRRNGEPFLALVRIFPVQHGGSVQQVLVLVQDLSEQEQIRSHAQQLEQRALLGEVTAIFAHEIRNPINNISTGLQWMALNLPENDPIQEAITRMMQDCDRLAELIKSVLAFSRPTDYEMEPFDLGAMLRRLLERLQPRIDRQQVRCTLHTKPDCPPVFGNLRALEQVFNNLITNALQAMSGSSKEGGQLALKVQPVNSPAGAPYLEVAVADTGPGIPLENQERIFQPFFTTQLGGTGLGLAIAKRIITAHKGNIRLESFPGGTVFYVQLPVAQPQGAQLSDTDMPSPQPTQQ